MNKLFLHTALFMALSLGFGSSAAAGDQTMSNGADMTNKPPPMTKMQEYVTKHGGTEAPFSGEYWDNHEEGIYVDVASGEPLFSSTDKFDSGTGWPSFTKPIKDNALEEKGDHKYGMSRTEVRSSGSDSHLGHVFDDGPKDKGGMRYCINSAALRFIPKDKMKEEGYGDYLYLFDKGASEDLGEVSH